MGYCQVPRPGLFLGALAATFLSASTIFAGAVVEFVDPILPTVIMYIILALISTPLMLRKDEWLMASRKQWFMAALSGILSAVYIFSRFESMKFMSPVDTTALSQIQLILVVILACLWLKEPVGIYELIFILLITIGAFMVTQPQFIFGSNSSNDYPLRYVGIILAFVVATMTAGMACITRSLHTTDPYLIGFLQGVTATAILLGIYASRRTYLPTPYQWIFVICASICGACTWLLFILAFKIEEASIVTAVRSVESIVTVILQILVLQEIPNWITILGAMIIMVGVIALSMKNQIIRNLRSFNRRNEPYDEIL